MSDQPVSLEIFPVAIGKCVDAGHEKLDVDAEVTKIQRLLEDFGGEITAWDVPMADRHGDKVNARLTQWAASHQPCALCIG